MKKTFHAIGLMSGSSLDGLDVAFCRLDTEQQGGSFRVEKWELLQAATLPLSTKWQVRLRQLPTASAFELANAHAAFGRYLGELVNVFFTQKKLPASEVDLIASHGHTIFHEPAQGFTLQIGAQQVRMKAFRPGLFQCRLSSQQVAADEDIVHISKNGITGFERFAPGFQGAHHGFGDLPM